MVHDPFTVCDKRDAQAAQVAYVIPPPLPDSLDTPCGVTVTPVTVLGAFVSVLRQWFGSPERVVMDKAKFLWNPDLARSSIFIATDYPWNLDGVNGKPGIFVEHGNVVDQPIHSLGTGKGNVVGIDNKTGAMTMANSLSADVSMRCLCLSNLEAWSLAFEVKTLFETFARAISVEYGFNSLITRGVIKPTPIKEYGDYMAATATVNYTIMSTWTVMPEALPLKSIYGIPIINPPQ